MIKPLKLKPGDKIGIISPSEPIVLRKRFEGGVETLKKLGFRPVLGKNVFREYSGYMAGRDSERISDLKAMFRNPEIKGIFCSYGGFNSNRLLDLIDYQAIKKNPKVFLGFSDITVLLNAIYKKTGLVTFHGENVEFGFSRGFSGRYKYTKEYFLKAVMSDNPIGAVLPFSGPINILKRGRAKGILVGGNLSVLMTLIGTKYEPDWRNKILFWEEFKETPQDIDFYLTSLRLCGVLDKISGMVIGRFTECDFPPDTYIQKEKVFPINKIILEICKNYKFPIIMGLPFGHVHPQIVLPIGVRAEIDTKKSLPFSIVERAVK